MTQEQKTLIAQLESDLSKVQPFLTAQGEGVGQSAMPPSSADIISEVLKDVQTDSAKVITTATLPPGEVGGADSLLPIVSSQRERFKQRNMELEAVS